MENINVYDSIEEAIKNEKKWPAFKCVWKDGKEPTDEQLEEIATNLGDLENNGRETVSFLGKNICPPRVGCVVKYKNAAYCAKRSAFKEGDHAEFTVLETMLPNGDLSEAVIYGTLEPCTKESRSPWTDSCSELIIKRNIKKAFVGSFDLNPLITGTGCQRLIENGVEVNLFTPRLAQRCLKQNKEFREQFGPVDRQIMKLIDSQIGDKLDMPSVKYYLDRQRSGNKKFDDKAEPNAEELFDFYRTFYFRGLIKVENKRVMVSPEFSLMFYADPGIVVPCFQVDIIDKRGAQQGKENEMPPIHKPLPKMIASDTGLFKAIEKCVGSKSGSAEKFEDRFVVEYRLFKEFVINALIHSSYSLGVPVQIFIERDKIVISNATNRKLPASIDNLESLPANPLLMQLMFECGLVQRLGYGHKDLYPSTPGFKWNVIYYGDACLVRVSFEYV